VNESFRYPWIVKRDIDGFFGLAIDNLIQFLLIATLCPLIAGIPSDFVFSRILPGAALSVVFGNLLAGAQARGEGKSPDRHRAPVRHQHGEPLRLPDLRDGPGLPGDGEL
jgi:hypothetical protein